MAMVPLIRLTVVTVPVSACWANATELMTASIEPAKTIFASLMENLPVFAQSEITRDERICSLVDKPRRKNAEFRIGLARHQHANEAASKT
jgi:hypothetical protein